MRLMYQILYILVIFSFESILANHGAEEDEQKLHLRKIREWWDIVSEAKPIKCNKIDIESKITNKAIFDHFKGSPGLQSSKCPEKESGALYKIRGTGLKVIDGVLQGTGKLIFLPKKSVLEDVSNKTCISPILFGISEVVEVVGTFVNGVLEGQTKIKYLNGTTSIGSFNHGYPHGFWRFWNKENQLVKVTMLYYGKEAEKCWAQESGLLIYTFCSRYERKDNDLAFVMEVDPDSDLIFSGRKLRSFKLIDDLHTTKITFVSSTRDCLLEVNHDERGNNLNKKLFFKKNYKNFIDNEFDPKTSVCSKITENSSLSNSKALRSFIKNVEEIASDSGQYLFEFAPTRESLDKEKALVLLPEIGLGLNYSINIEISVLNGSVSTYEIIEGDFDSEFRCHGLCTIKLAERFINKPKTPKTPRIEEEATSPLAAKISPRSKHLLVKVDIFSKNGHKVTEDLPTSLLIGIWTSLDSDAEIDGCSSHRIANGVRAHFYLKQHVSLSELHPEPEFTYESEAGVYQCRIVGLTNLRAPRDGETITVCITRTHFCVPMSIIERWIGKFAKIVTSPRHLVNQDGIKTERIVVDVAFEEEIPEWLPILSKKARIYYPGIKRQCHKCYETKHHDKISWKKYCDKLFETGRFDRDLFGHWIKPTQSDKPPEAKTDLREFLKNPESLKEMVSIFKEIQKQEKGDKAKRREKNKPSQAQAPKKGQTKGQQRK